LVIQIPPMESGKERALWKLPVQSPDRKFS
jgi:hypothetical protein